MTDCFGVPINVNDVISDGHPMLFAVVDIDATTISLRAYIGDGAFEDRIQVETQKGFHCVVVKATIEQLRTGSCENA